MNQILMTDNKKGGANHELKPVIKFFAIVIILVALIIGGGATYNVYNSFGKDDSFPKPTVSMQKDGSKVNVTVTGEIEINKIEYYWNDGSKSTLNGNARKKVDFELDIPQGDNSLNMTVIDIKGNKTDFSKVGLKFDEAEESLKPTISLVTNEIGKIVVTVTDENALDYMTYQWEDQDEVKVMANSEEPKTITQNVEVQKGTKKLTIKAYNKAGKKQEITKTIVGSSGSEIKATIENNQFVVKVIDEVGLTKITYVHTYDGVPHEVTIDDIPENTKEYEFKVDLKQGDNFIKVNAFNKDVMTEYKGRKTL